VTALLALLLLLPAAVGLAFLRRRLSQAAFFAAEHGASAWLVGLAGTAIGLSAFTFVGGPALLAASGTGALWMILPAPITGVLQCWLWGGFLLERKPRPLTLPQLLGEDLGPQARLVAALLLGLGCLAGLAVQAKGVGVLAQVLLGGKGELWALGLFLATLAYTAAGGMRAGVWVDAVQGLFMGLVALALAFSAIQEAGSTGALSQLASQGASLLGSFGHVPPGQAFSWYLLFTLGTLAQPHYLQKFFFLRSPKELEHLPWTLTGSLMVILTVWVGLGLAAAALVQAGELPAAGDKVIPLLLQRLGKGAVLAASIGCFCAIMSTVASFLNLLAAALTLDLPSALGSRSWSLPWARAATALAALLGLLFGLASGRTLAFLGLLGWGFFTASFLPALLAVRFRCGSTKAALAAMLVGASTCLAAELFRPHLPAGAEPGLLGAAAGLAVIYLFSVATKPGPNARWSFSPPPKSHPKELRKPERDLPLGPGSLHADEGSPNG